MTLATLEVVGQELVERGSDFDLAVLDREIEAAEAGEASTDLGISLGRAIHRFGIPAFPLRGRGEALRAERDTKTFSSRQELLGHARRLSHPTARAGLHILGLADEREAALGEALATGLRLTAWMDSFPSDWRSGRLRIPTDELARFDVVLSDLDAPRVSPGLQRLLDHEITESRRWLAKGWPLTRTLGPWNGRRLAAFLRWHAASLSAIEVAGHDARRATRGGVLRGMACGLVAAISPRSPF